LIKQSSQIRHLFKQSSQFRHSQSSQNSQTFEK